MKIIKIFFTLIIFMSLNGCVSKSYEMPAQNTSISEQNPTYQIVRSENTTVKNAQKEENDTRLKVSTSTILFNFLYVGLYLAWLYDILFD